MAEIVSVVSLDLSDSTRFSNPFFHRISLWQADFRSAQHTCPYSCSKAFLYGTAVYADSYRNAVSLCAVENTRHIVFSAYVAGIYSDFVGAVFNSGDGKSEIEMNVGNQRQADSVLDFFSASASERSSTATRTISQPAPSSSLICFIVASVSAVRVFVMDCTAILFPPPSSTSPTFTTLENLICLFLCQISQYVNQYNETEQQNHANRMNPALDLSVYGLAEYPFDKDEYNSRTVQCRQRQQIENRKIDGNQRDKEQHVGKARPDYLSGHIDCSYRAADVFNRHPSGNQSPQSFEYISSRAQTIRHASAERLSESKTVFT